MFKLLNFCNLLYYLFRELNDFLLITIRVEKIKFHSAFALPFCYEYFSLAQTYHIFIHQYITILILYYCSIYNNVNNIIILARFI